MRVFDDSQLPLRSTRMVDRFLSYVRIDTQSEADSDTCPSTEKQWTLARQLVDELNEIGMSDVSIDDNGYVLATLPGSVPGSVGFCAHYDTTPQFTGTAVHPQIHAGYDGKRLDVGNGVVLDPEETPELRKCVGDTLITTDGTTLLGADDKAGIAEIMAAMEILLREEGIVHPTIRVCFNPDEEIGRGANRFPMDRFDCPIAFTMDGGYSGDLNVETFSADAAVVTFTGVSVHPGTARGKLVNALTYMGKFLTRLPADESPETTDDRDGFVHPTRVSGDAAGCSVDLILRDFDNDLLAQRGERVKAMAEALEAEEPRLGVDVQIREQYRNMFGVLRDHPDVAEKMRRAVELAGVAPRMSPIRGGTDGSRLTAMGLPTPNIFAGGLNMHGPKECVSTRVMGEATCTILNLVQLLAGPLA